MKELLAKLQAEKAENETAINALMRHSESPTKGKRKRAFSQAEKDALSKKLRAAWVLRKKAKKA